MAFRVEVSTRAERDLDKIYDDIEASASPDASAWFNGLERIVLALSDFPKRGSAAREGKGFRQLPYGRKPHIYRIIYSIDERAKVVAIAHVRHGARENWVPENEPDTG